MADINNVNYLEMKKQISAIWSKGGELQTALINIYKEINSISSIWSGKKCNTFLDSWNKNLNSIITYSRFLEFELPVYLNKVVSRFSEVDGAKVGTSGYGWGSGLSEVKMTPEQTLRFRSQEVRSFQQRMEKNLNIAKVAIDNLYTKVSALPWDSTSSSAFLPTFKTLTTNAKNSVSTTFNAMNNMINQTANEVERAESLNKNEGQSFGKSNK